MLEIHTIDVCVRVKHELRTHLNVRSRDGCDATRNRVWCLYVCTCFLKSNMDLDTDDLDTDLDTDLDMDLDMDTAQPATVAIYRGFSDLPAEMIDMIIDYSDTPELQNDELGKKRLAWAFTWTRMCVLTPDKSF